MEVEERERDLKSRLLQQKQGQGAAGPSSSSSLAERLDRERATYDSSSAQPRDEVHHDEERRRYEIGGYEHGRRDGPSRNGYAPNGYAAQGRHPDRQGYYEDRRAGGGYYDQRDRYPPRDYQQYPQGDGWGSRTQDEFGRDITDGRADAAYPGPPPRPPPAQGDHDAGYDGYPRDEHTAPGSQGGGWQRRPPQSRPGAPGLVPIGGGNAGNFLASRQQQREAMRDVVIWPESPREPYLDSDEERAKRKAEKEKRRSSRRDRDSRHSRSSRHHHHRSDRDRSRSRDRHHSSKHHSSSRRHDDDRHRSRRSSSRKHRSSRHKYSDESDSASESDDDEARRRRRKEKQSERKESRSTSPDRSRSSRKKHRSSRTRSPSSGSDSASEDDRRVSKRDRTVSREADTKAKSSAQEDDSDVEIGPQLPAADDGGPVDPRSFGGALLPGEGSAMAAYVAEGKRIPRRGEIGMESDQIEAFERAGFVMSGSRHKRMNAVRMRKENQVISAEEKRSILKMQKEEKMKKEAQIVGQFKEMIDTAEPQGR